MPDFSVIIMPGKKGTSSEVLIYTSEARTWGYFATEYLYNSFPISQSSQLSVIFAGSPSSSSSLAATLVRRHPEGKIAQQPSDSCLSLCPGVCHAPQNHPETFSVDVTNCKLPSNFLYVNPAKYFTAFGSPPPTACLNFGLFPP